MAEIAAETERLVLRDWRDEDRAPFAAMCADPDVMRHFPSRLDRRESDALVDRVSAHLDQHGFGLWAVERKEDDAFLGFTGLQFVQFACPIEGEVEIGWRLARGFWRQGYAYEAASASLDWFWRNRREPRVVSMTIPDNRPSWGLMEKLGLSRADQLTFDHPRIDANSRCRRHIVYVKERPECAV